jgi:hypothetical protein
VPTMIEIILTKPTEELNIRTMHIDCPSGVSGYILYSTCSYYHTSHSLVPHHDTYQPPSCPLPPLSVHQHLFLGAELLTTIYLTSHKVISVVSRKHCHKAKYHIDIFKVARMSDLSQQFLCFRAAVQELAVSMCIELLFFCEPFVGNLWTNTRPLYTHNFVESSVQLVIKSRSFCMPDPSLCDKKLSTGCFGTGLL